MPEQTAHPSEEKLNAYNRGLLSPDEAITIETHISDCEPCCETIVSLSSDDTFVGLLKEARQLPTERTLDHDSHGTESTSFRGGIPSELAQHPRYEIVRLIGKGGMGDVYEAIHRKMERRVALKVINRQLFQKAEAVSRFHREVKTAAQLSHPNVVTSHDADQAGDFHFMVMEFVDGVDLSQIVKSHGALPVVDACDYVRQAAVGLQHAHERGMVHRDIKPHNLMVTADGTLKILDFGLASLAPEAFPASDAVAASSDLTAAGAIMGTPDFISPEQASDARQVDIRSDIYSLGATFYYLLSGRVPFADGSVMHKLKSHAQVEPAPLNSVRDDVPEKLVAIASKMMAKDPDERYLTPSEVADALESFLRTYRPNDAESPRHELSSGGNMSGSGGQTSGANDMSPDWIPVLGKWLFYMSLIPIALLVLDTFFWSDEASDAPDRTMFYIVTSVALSTIGGILAGIHQFNSGDRDNHRKNRWPDSQTMLFGFIILGAGTFYLFETDHGVVRIEVNDPSLQVSILGQTITMEDGVEKPLTITPGEWPLLVSKEDVGFRFHTDSFRLRRSDEITFKVEVVNDEIVVFKDGEPFDRQEIFDLRRELQDGDDRSPASTSPSKPELKITSKTVNKGTAGLPSLYDWNFKGRDVGDLKVRLLLAQNGKTEVMQEFDFEELPAEFAGKVRLQVKDAATGADHKKRVNSILYVESPVPSRSTTTNEDKALSIDVEAPFSNKLERADLKPIEPGQTELLLALSYWKGDMTHDLSMESMTAATKDGNVTFLFVTLDWSPTFVPTINGKDTEQILKQMTKTYAECKSYCDSGVIKSVIFKDTDSAEVTLEHSFITVFVRPDRFRFEIMDQYDDELLISLDGEDVQTSWDIEPGFPKPESLELAMAQAVGFTGGDVGRIPAMLMPKKLDGWVDLDLIDPIQIEDGKLQNVECFRLEYNFRDEQIILWIDKQSHLVRRIDERIESDGIRISERTTTYDPTIDGKITETMLEFDPPARRAADDSANTLPGSALGGNDSPPPPAQERDADAATQKAGQQRSDNHLEMPLCWCPAGEFKMGRKQLPVTLTRGFWMGKYEVTQAQYEALMGENPSENKGESLPVEKVEWTKATKFCQKFTELERKAGRLPKGWEYRLPTEAQWEYACRAGTTLIWDEKDLVYPSTFGDDLSELGDYAWYGDNCDGTPHPGGQKKPNAWGLCDMYGNVSEWVRDAWQSKLTGGKDPEVDVSFPIHTLRGGNWLSYAEPCGSPFIRGFVVGGREEPHMMGFRVALVSVDGADDSAAVDADLTQLQGEWETASLTESGKQLTAESGFGGVLLQIKGNTFVIAERKSNGETPETDTGRIEIGSTATPQTIDFIDRDQPDQRSLGIYELKDGMLRICLVEQGGTDAPAGERIPDTKPLNRPTTFDSPTGSNVMLMEFTRNEPAKVNDIPNILGTWQVTYSEDGGRIAPQEMLKELRFVIDEQNLTTEIGGRKSVSTYKLDPSTNPKSIDLTEDGRTKQAIYDLVGDTLRICIAESGEQRPTAFDSQPNSANDIVLMLKRVKPGEASADGTDDQKHNAPLSEELARSLIPPAASISNEDFLKLQTNPAAQTIKNKSLSLVLMTLDIRDQSPEAANDFRFLVGGYPKPSEIAAAMSPSRSKGYFSIIQPDYITECKITNSTNEIAQGKVTFNAPKLYIGSATFEARKHERTWRIEKFHLPLRQISIELGEDGNWHPEGKETEGKQARDPSDSTPDETPESSISNAADIGSLPLVEIFDTTYINKDTVGLLVAHPQRILTRKSKVKEGFDQMFAKVAESEGLDIRNLRQIVAQLGPPPLSSRPIRNLFDEQIWTLILRFNEPVDVTSYINNHASGYTKAEHKGETYYQHDGRMEMWFPDDRTLVCAAERRILSLIDEPEGKGPVAARMGRVDAVDDLLLEFEVRRAGPLLLESLPAEAQNPEVYPFIEQTIQQHKRITVTAKQTSDALMLARLHANDAETAIALHDQVSVLLDKAKREWPQLRDKIRERPADKHTKLANAFADEVDSVLPAIRLTVDEDHLLVQVEKEGGVDLAALLVFSMLID